MASPKKYTEAFFQWTGWYVKPLNNGKEIVDWWWDENGMAKGKDGVTIYEPPRLPPLHEYLDVQEEWLWPELLKVGCERIEFSWWKDEKVWFANLGDLPLTNATAPTKAIAQLTAGCKALGIEVKERI